ncbi:protein PLASTID TRANSCRIPTIONALLY ACTIVE 16, chloroplastic [Andrographis paniculata]|uniref:protein PLASTID TRANSCRIPTIONALLY ACTIVE 16, chloroplastic n=1 Tax=Andrographis paniculata TaxID=175694 RepID=UPI0021E91DE7|nr:protein PLASTID TRANSCRIPTIONALLY ACTIVE 16, chloroplastic [Andrographis paniculata]
MAPTLTSNSFLVGVAPHRSHLALHRRRLAVKAFAKAAAGGDEGGNSSPFRFDFAKLGDVKSLVPAVANPTSGLSFGRRKDPATVFVAGATGQAGIRIAQTLLRQGFSVRAGVPDLAAAQELALLAAKYKIISNEESKKLNAVNSTFDDVESIAKAIGNASKVVVTISPAENGPSAEVTTSDALRVIQAAQAANVGHIAIIYDTSSGNSSSYNVLDGITSFFSNLFSRAQPLTAVEFLQKVVETDLGYTLIRTRLTDDFSPENSYNVIVSNEESSAGAEYKVTKSQIASLVADVFSNVEAAENKVLNVTTDPTAPSKPISDVLRDIPEDNRRKLYAEAVAKAKAEEEATRASQEPEEATTKQEQQPKTPKEDTQAAKLAAEAQKLVEAASVDAFFTKAKDITSGFSWDSFSAQLKSAVQKPEGENEPKVEVATVRGQARARSLPAQKALVKNQARPSSTKSRIAPKPKAKPAAETKVETRKVFGGLFKQETIYVDDD